MINIEDLKESDIGRWVIYRNDYPGGIDKIGKIKLWNYKYIFVVYNCNNDWDNFKNYTGQATRPENLEFYKNDTEKPNYILGMLNLISNDIKASRID